MKILNMTKNLLWKSKGVFSLLWYCTMSGLPVRIPDWNPIKKELQPQRAQLLVSTIQLHTFTESKPLAAKILLPNMEWSSIAEAFILFSQVLNR
ncbi:hypothetical protein P4H83_28480 [Paenibacillus favisporus]|uniref:hypothetical protein n=1 Tax=Paenibacillus favisporus TaxID=221028 RepID=UPI002DBC114C|nr:hypothetical protein [Paenibacillus favisporus]MEC0178827.1 hypothetical protein [Paenibacillus favisporus]